MDHIEGVEVVQALSDIVQLEKRVRTDPHNRKGTHETRPIFLRMCGDVLRQTPTWHPSRN